MFHLTAKARLCQKASCFVSDAEGSLLWRYSVVQPEKLAR